MAENTKLTKNKILKLDGMKWELNEFFCQQDDLSILIEEKMAAIKVFEAEIRKMNPDFNSNHPTFVRLEDIDPSSMTEIH